LVNWVARPRAQAMGVVLLEDSEDAMDVPQDNHALHARITDLLERATRNLLCKISDAHCQSAIDPR
jgi:hypothetical protein